MAPVLHELEKYPQITSRLCVTAQHREMMDQGLAHFGLEPDYDLDLMRPSQSLNGIAAAILRTLDPVLEQFRPDIMLVHGDTATSFSAALAGFYRNIAIGHVEAGLRSGDLQAPFPEEGNRRLTSTIAKYHFAPTQRARLNLLREGIDDAQIHVTGNTIIDALKWTQGLLDSNSGLEAHIASSFSYLRKQARLVLITAHRRENMGRGISDICRAIGDLSWQFPEVDFVFPLHPNPALRDFVLSQISKLANVHLIRAQDYLEFIWLMRRASLILTDSGSIQEEAPALSKPVLVMRDVTERSEMIDVGAARLVGTETAEIIASVAQLLSDDGLCASMRIGRHPYGDGNAAQRIVSILLGENEPVPEKHDMFESHGVG